MGGQTEASRVRSDLRRSLSDALKSRDPVAIAAFRSALSAIDNAEAADLAEAPPIQHGVIAGGVGGLGAGEVRRRDLDRDTCIAILVGEIEHWNRVASDYERLGRRDDAARLRAEGELLQAFLDGQE